MEPFTLVEETTRPGPHRLFDDVVHLTSGLTADHDLQYIVALRRAHEGVVVTAIPSSNVPLRAFAAAGFATCELDTETDSFASWRGYRPPTLRHNKGNIAESVHFAKYHYKFANEDFVLYTLGAMQYVLKERRDSESALGPSRATDTLIQTIGDWLLSDQEVVWVYDRYWTRSKPLWQQVQRASWDKVILDENVKKELTEVANKFFASRDVYKDLGVPWKRGLLFHGPPGNGKTISIKALMKTLLDREDPIPALYVKSAPQTYDIRNVFSQARALAPCMLILEDIETIVTAQTRSYFFNEMDGLENNDGLFVVASTNFLDRLDPGLTKRPSRFDRKYLFPLPNEHERMLYCEYWRHKLSSKRSIDFPKKLCPAMAHVTSGFSFAFLQECFVATLLILARRETGIVERADDDLDNYELWRTFKQQADILRKEVEGQQEGRSQLLECCESARPTDQAAQPSPVTNAQCDHCTRESRLPDLQHLYVKDAILLPELPPNFQKRAFINTAAFEYK
ncbi:hypothetical protein LTR36_009671 [Oleoguttula mirabilis]|uniref:AAA+ ATPase domain-containing protein n=1 Tax=Oleoguttula mirabilis TaxID=1507867 RepID=A0AAV9J5Y5_9PEZI|nr:hypothetical protein LTR36_009671 [Oleoguttula mirabilis]